VKQIETRLTYQLNLFKIAPFTKTNMFRILNFALTLPSLTVTSAFGLAGECWPCGVTTDRHEMWQTRYTDSPNHRIST